MQAQVENQVYTSLSGLSDSARDWRLGVSQATLLHYNTYAHSRGKPQGDKISPKGRWGKPRSIGFHLYYFWHLGA